MTRVVMWEGEPVNLQVREHQYVLRVGQSAQWGPPIYVSGREIARRATGVEVCKHCHRSRGAIERFGWGCDR